MKPTPCPSCQQTMSKHRFERLHHGEVILDLCYACQGIWFDDFESVQITPGGIIELFKLLNEHRDDLRQPLRDPLHCPRCRKNCCTASTTPSTVASSTTTAACKNMAASPPLASS